MCINYCNIWLIYYVYSSVIVLLLLVKDGVDVEFCVLALVF